MKNVLHSSPFFILFLIACVLICVSLLSNIQRSLNRKAGLNTLQAELTQRKEENAELKKKIEEAKDPVVREKKIRNELNYSLPDESIVQLNRPIPTPEPESKLQALPKKSQFQPPLQQWISLFSAKQH